MRHGPAAHHPKSAAPSWRPAALAAIGLLLLTRHAGALAPPLAEPPQEAGRRRLPRPFEGSYGITLANAILALAPFIVITTAYALFSEQVRKTLQISTGGTEIIAGLSTAGYAWGALLGGDLVQRQPQRHLFLGCETLFAIGCLLSAAAGGVVVYGAGRILAGFATGMLLVITLPPVIQKFPAGRMPVTVVAVNIGFFGAVCIGPLLGGWIAAVHGWRWFYGGLAALGAANAVLAVFTLPDAAAMHPGRRFDWQGILLGLAATVLPFWAAGELITHGFASPLFAAPLFVGLVCLTGLLVFEYRDPDPLSPVKRMWTTYPVLGTLIAMVAGAGFISLLELGERFQMQVAHLSPLQTGVLFWPLAVGVLITAAVFGAILRTRLIPLLILAGMICIAGAGALMLQLAPAASAGVTLGAAGLLGLGAGATVSPGLYLAGFPITASIIGRIFALVELVRSVADYLMAPVVMQVAREASGGGLSAHGVHLGIWITILVTAVFTAFGLWLYWAGGDGLPVPDLENWIDKGGTAIDSPPLLARLRRS